MGAELQTRVTALVAKCECAIRRGAAAEPDKLHTLQRQLVAARDEPSRERAEDRLRTALRFYAEHVPQEARRTDLAELTAELERLAASLDAEFEDGIVAGD